MGQKKQLSVNVRRSMGKYLELRLRSNKLKQLGERALEEGNWGVVAVCEKQVAGLEETLERMHFHIRAMHALGE